MALKLLVLNASPTGKNSQSCELTQHFLEQAALHAPNKYTVTHRDLSRETLPHIDAHTIDAFIPDAKLSVAAEAFNTIAYTLIDELKSADVIVLATPLHNFTVPTVLKSYIDLVARAGLTFTYTDKGPQGLLVDRPVVVITTAGGRYIGTPIDFMGPYLKTVLNFIGLTNIHFVAAEGLGMSDHRDASIAGAKNALSQLAKGL